MAISDSVSRMAASLLAVVRNRLELAAVEFEEEALRLFSLLLSSLLAFFFLALAITLLVVLVAVVFWDTHRIAVLLSLALISAFTGISIALSAQRKYQQKPRLLADTVNELAKDMASLRAVSKQDEQ